MSAYSLSAVYSQIFSDYSVSSTRYDSHKKDELESIYHQIVKKSEDSHVYMPDKTGSSQAYAISLKEDARFLKNSISSLSSEYSSSILDKKVASSSDSDIVSAEYIAAGNSSNIPDSFDIFVEQLASPQLNIGNFLPTGETSPLSPNLYSFDILINDSDYEFQFAVDASDTNDTIEQRIARLINKSSIGVNATVISGKGTSALRIESNASGQRADGNPTFSISDESTSKTSGAVAYFGLNSVAHEPTDAVFIINDKEHKARSNTFTVQRAYEITLNGINEEGSDPVHIGLKPDLDALTENINHLAGAYNDFIRRADEYSILYGQSNKFMREMNGITKRFTNSLDAVGMSLKTDGTFEIDTKLLQTSATESDPRKSLSAVQQFTDALVSETKRISIDPMQYTDRKIATYRIPGVYHPNPYMSSMYTGMLFSSFC